ncbi:hypothetical protein KAS42_05870, partial [bacterium]|nr:hypothetical protein [bacterium]
PVRNRSPLDNCTSRRNVGTISNGVNVDFLKSCDEVFLTSSLIEVMSVVRIDNALINNAKIGRYSVMLREGYRNMVNEYLTHAKQLEVTNLFGTIDFDKNYDYKMRRKR